MVSVLVSARQGKICSHARAKNAEAAEELTEKQINDLALLDNGKSYEAHKPEQQALCIMDNEVIYAK